MINNFPAVGNNYNIGVLFFLFVLHYLSGDGRSESAYVNGCRTNLKVHHDLLVLLEKYLPPIKYDQKFSYIY